MANVLISIEKKLEAGAEDILKFLTGAENKIQEAGPTVIAGLGTLAGSVETAVTNFAEAAAQPLNIALDAATAKSFVSVWPAVKTFLGDLGIKI